MKTTCGLRFAAGTTPLRLKLLKG